MDFKISLLKLILTSNAILLISASPLKRIDERSVPGLAKYPDQANRDPQGLENFPDVAIDKAEPIERSVPGLAKYPDQANRDPQGLENFPDVAIDKAEPI
jgi:hypothetical protein